MEQIFELLSNDSRKSQFATTTLETLEKFSPTSLKVCFYQFTKNVKLNFDQVIFEQLRRGEKLDLKHCFEMEAKMCEEFFVQQDFYEVCPV